MSENPSELMACFVELSSNKERTTLEQSVVRTLTQLLACDVRLIHLYNGRGELEPEIRLRGHSGGKVEFETNNLSDYCVDLFEVIKQYLEDLNHHEAKDIYNACEGKILWPLTCDEKCIGLLLIDLQTKSEYDLKLLDAIGCIFSNFLALLNASERDALTGLYNRRMFDTQLSSMVRSTMQSYGNDLERRQQQQLPSNYLGIIDIDFFKRVNDDFGHLFGDEVLLWLAQKMRQCFRNEDALFRYGGEEFAVLLSGLSQVQAMETFERFRQTIESTRFPQIGQITVSIGFSSIDKQANPTLVFGDADKALYYAKEHGRNQVHCYQTLVENGLIDFGDSDDDIELF